MDIASEATPHAVTSRTAEPRGRDSEGQCQSTDHRPNFTLQETLAEDSAKPPGAASVLNGTKHQARPQAAPSSQNRGFVAYNERVKSKFQSPGSDSSASTPCPNYSSAYIQQMPFRQGLSLPRGAVQFVHSTVQLQNQ